MKVSLTSQHPVCICGAVAQLGERLTGSQEVGSSILLGSTCLFAYLARFQLNHGLPGSGWGQSAPVFLTIPLS